MVKPYDSSAGLLSLAILLSICVGERIYDLIQIAMTGHWDVLGRTWGMSA